jgi:hypothetical protein
MIEDHKQLWNHANKCVMHIDILLMKFVMSKEQKYVCESKAEKKRILLYSLDEIFTL